MRSFKVQTFKMSCGVQGGVNCQREQTAESFFFAVLCHFDSALANGLRQPVD